jgi:hypothetical protein
MTVLDREVTKSWLQKSSVYNNFVGELSDLVKQDQAKKGSENPDGGFDTEAITRAAKEAFPPATLQENVEAVLDGAYDWLEQKTSTLVINLDFSQEKQIFIDAMGNEGLSRIASLPACQSSETTEDFDPFSATCLPSGANASALMDSFKSEIASSDSVLPDTTLNSADITIDYKGEKKPIDVAFSEAPSWYGLLTSSPIILAVLVVIDSALIVLLSKPKRSGFKILSWFFGIVGSLVMLFGGTNILLKEMFVKNALKDSGGNGVAESILLPIIREVAASIGKWSMIIGGIYIAIAVGLAILYIILKKKNPEAGDEENKEPVSPAPVEEKPQQPASTPKVQ